jgi:hypothetical protein
MLAGSTRLNVLIMGSSSVTYGESTDESTLPGLTQKLLRRERPEIEWTCVSERLFQGPTMSDRALKLVERRQPDVAVLYLQKSQFQVRKVVFRIRNRWPAFYDRAQSLALLLKGWAGGGSYGSAGARGWIFRAPAFLAAKVIGADPDIWVDDAIRYTKETIEALARSEDLTLIVKMPKETSTSPRTAEQLEWAERYRQAVVARCQARRIPAYTHVDNRPPVKRPWLRRSAPDGIHSPIDTREDHAETLAAQVLAALAGRSTAAPV